MAGFELILNMKVSLLNNDIQISFKYNPQLVAFVKSFPARRYDPILKCWFVPIVSAEAEMIVKKLQNTGFEILPEIWEALRAEKMKDDAVVDFNSLLPLFNYQKTGVEFLLKKGSALLADEVGLGKTVQTLAFIEQTKPKNVLVLCPAILKYQWQEEIKRFLPDFKTGVVDGAAGERHLQWLTNVNIQIANYELLLHDFTDIHTRKWDLIVCDEATRISNPYTKTYKALNKLWSANRVALTGTPISNRPDEIWAIINWLYPGVLGSYQNFLDYYCIRNHWGGIFGYRKLEELQARIQKFMIRRLKIDVLPELPEKIYYDVPFNLSDEETDLYEKIRKELLFEIEKELLNKIENPITIQQTLTKMLRFKQLTGSMELLGEGKKSTKLEVLKELLPSILNGTQKAIIFTFFSSMADILERELAEYKPLKITGDVKGREEIIKKFNENPEHRIFISTSAGQYGLNLQSASVLFHYDNEWSLAKMEQRVGRLHRIQQKENVLIYYLTARNTIDEYIKKVLFKKQELSNKLLSDNVGPQEIREILTYGRKT